MSLTPFLSENRDKIYNEFKDNYDQIRKTWNSGKTAHNAGIGKHIKNRFIRLIGHVGTALDIYDIAMNTPAEVSAYEALTSNLETYRNGQARTWGLRRNHYLITSDLVNWSYYDYGGSSQMTVDFRYWVRGGQATSKMNRVLLVIILFIGCFGCNQISNQNELQCKKNISEVFLQINEFKGQEKELDPIRLSLSELLSECNIEKTIEIEGFKSVSYSELAIAADSVYHLEKALAGSNKPYLIQPYNRTLLHYAVFYSSKNSIIYLIDMGLGPLAEDEQGYTPIDLVQDAIVNPSEIAKLFEREI